MSQYERLKSAIKNKFKKPDMHCQKEIEADLKDQDFISDQTLFRWLLLFLIIITAVNRLLFPDMFLVGGDTTGHVLNGFELLSSNLFKIVPLSDNFFQLLLTERHGYTTILFSAIFYGFVFGVLHIPITEVTLLVVHVIWGIGSLLAIYYFLNGILGSRKAFWTTLLISLIPMHIGLSRAHASSCIFQILFYYLSLSFLHRYVSLNKKKYLILYSIATLFYIGSDNAFPLGLFLHVTYLFLLLKFKRETFSTGIKYLKKIYMSPWALLVYLPIIGYMAVTYVSLQMGVNSGFLIRSISKIKESPESFYNILIAFMYHGVLSSGPLLLVALVGMLFFKRSTNHFIKWFVLLSVILYTIFLLFFYAFSEVGGGVYFIYIAIPLLIYLGTIVSSNYIYLCSTVVGIIYAFHAVYGFSEIGLDSIPRKEYSFSFGCYGLLDNKIKNLDYGIKTLGYLVRSGEIPVSFIDVEIQIGSVYKQVKKIGVFAPLEGAQFYFANEFHGWAIRDIQSGMINRHQNPIVVISPYFREIDSQLKRYVESLNLQAIITRKDIDLLYIYTRNKVSNIQTYDTDIYNLKFDDQYGYLSNRFK